MGWASRVVLVVCLLSGVAALGGDETLSTPLLPCGQGASGTPNCNPSKKELKEAKAAYAKGLKLQSAKQSEAAYDQFNTAAQLVPRDINYLTAREMSRQQLVTEHLKRGNDWLTKGQQVESLAEFRSALDLDPSNEFAQQRLHDALGEWEPHTPDPPEVLSEAGSIRLVPDANTAEFHFRGDSRELLNQIAKAFGVVATVDESVTSRQVRFNIDAADFFTAMGAAGRVTNSFWSPLGEKQIVVAADNAENHKQFDRMGLRTFYLPWAVSPTDVNDVVNLLRTVLEIRFVNPQPQAGRIVVRAPQRALDAATQLLESLPDARPQVMLDIHVYEISSMLMRNIGLHIPNQFQLFNIPAGALLALGGQNIQDLINQLISNGGINQAGSQSLSGLLAQLGNQQNSIFSQPLATFGNGLTLTGLSLGTASVQLQLNESTARSLEHATLRVAQGNEGSFKIGSRFPILNASFAPVFNTAAISQNIQNNTFQAAFPSFNYEDIGLTVKAKPSVNTNRDVSLALEMQIRSLGGQTINGVPVISNREYKGSIVLAEAQPAVIAGSVSRTELRSFNGIPGFGQVPLLNNAVTTNSNEVDNDELLIIITPHIISTAAEKENAEIWMSR